MFAVADVMSILAIKLVGGTLVRSAGAPLAPGKNSAGGLRGRKGAYHRRGPAFARTARGFALGGHDLCSWLPTDV